MGIDRSDSRDSFDIPDGLAYQYDHTACPVMDGAPGKKLTHKQDRPFGEEAR